MKTIDPEQIFSIRSTEQFNERALDIFRYQARECAVYRDFVRNLNINPESVHATTGIPFLPVELFKNHPIISGNKKPEIIFSSSGTTGMTQSKHPVVSLSVYEESFRKGFRHFYGNAKNLCILALLPSYLEREGSSLIYMVDDLIRQSQHEKSGYFLHNHEDLYQTLEDLKKQGASTVLIGVTYALLDFVDRYTVDFPDLIVMETGGMKGKRREMIREELHEILGKGFGVPVIHSEYGMTELLSQAYSKGNGIFECPPWMNISIRDINDPLSLLSDNKTGGINVIDLANIHSCSFIATLDLGKKFKNGNFVVLGRFDNSDIRGCNLLVQ